MAKKHAKRFRGHQDFRIGLEVTMSYLETFVNHMFCKEEQHMCRCRRMMKNVMLSTVEYSTIWRASLFTQNKKSNYLSSPYRFCFYMLCVIMRPYFYTYQFSVIP